MDYTSYQQNADAFDAVIQQSIVDSVPGITQSDIYDFFVTAGSRRLQSAVPKKVENDAARPEDVAPRRRGGDAKDLEGVPDAARGSTTDVLAAAAPAVEPQKDHSAKAPAETERRANLRSEASFHTAAASIVAQYRIVLTGSGQSYEQVANNIQAAVETGQFETAMQENAVAAGVPELANATSSTITTVDVGGTDDSSGDGSSNSTALSLPVIVGVAVGCGAVIGMIIAAFYFYCIRPPSGTSQRNMAHSFHVGPPIPGIVAWIVALALFFRFHYADSDLIVVFFVALNSAHATNHHDSSWRRRLGRQGHQLVLLRRRDTAGGRRPGPAARAGPHGTNGNLGHRCGAGTNSRPRCQRAEHGRHHGCILPGPGAA